MGCLHLKVLIDNLNAGGFKAKSAIIEDIESICIAYNKLKDENLTDFDVSEICKALSDIKSQKAPNKVHLNDKGYPTGNIDVILIQEALDTINQKLEEYQTSLVEKTSSENRNIDAPLYYNFHSLISTCFDYAIKESAVSQDKMNEYISTLKLRMQSFVDDVRLASPLLLNKQKDINDVLVQFLAYILGDYSQVYNTIADDSTYKEYYNGNECSKSVHNLITIIDMSLLPFQVLETITGLVGRLILEFLSRFDKDERGKMPVVIALEEAQNYIPENNQKDRDSISRKVFERIAREGRKYGLSLLVSSQRPSELSKTVLSQCNSFIVHRIQNPDDQTYIRKLVSAANSEILSQLPTLPQQHVIIMGDCVRTPVVARMNTAKPKPNSNDPEFVDNWIKSEKIDYKKYINKWLENDEKEV